MTFTILEKIGNKTTTFIEEVGQLANLQIQTLYWMFRRPFRFHLLIKQMEEIGANSIPVVLVTALSTGMVLALQSHIGFKRFNAETLVGTVVALSVTRELGPVLTGLIVAGRAGSSMAAELGTMRVTEQIDALVTLATNPIHYLIVPRFLAGLIMLPILTICADMVGILGGYIVSTRILGANPVIYIRRTRDFLELGDVFNGLFKSAVFGMSIAIISCYAGFYTEGGAEGVGKATTRAVVISSMLILISDYIMTALLF
jgi:phospholipid/cholesterol/gamma-HCH transport system permease protein